MSGVPGIVRRIDLVKSSPQALSFQPILQKRVRAENLVGSVNLNLGAVGRGGTLASDAVGAEQGQQVIRLGCGRDDVSAAVIQKHGQWCGHVGSVGQEGRR